MPVVTLTTDFGWQDHYLPTIKGAILSKNDRLNLVDITHQVKPYDIVQAAFIFKNTWNSFPSGTIHLISVNDYAGDTGFVAIRHEGHFFIGPDNGVFSLIFPETPKDVYRLETPSSTPFPLKEIYATAIGHIANGFPFNEIGFPAERMMQRITFQPVIAPSQIKGSVIYVDNYENVIVNITRERFEQVGRNRPFSLYFKRNDPITRLCTHYNDVAIGETLCLFNSVDYLEIAVNMGKAASLLGLSVEEGIQIDFYTNTPE